MISANDYSLDMLSFCVDGAMRRVSLNIVGFHRECNIEKEGYVQKKWSVLHIQFYYYSGIYLEVLGHVFCENCKPSWWESVFPHG